MKLKKILSAHYQTIQKNSIRNNLGDAYLLRHNAIFRNVRQEVLRLGFRFTQDRFYDYDSLSLTQLPKILSKKTIPYCDNVRPLEDIEKTLPGHFLWHEVPPLRQNTLLHESAHGLAHHFIHQRLKRSQNKSELTLQILIEEAFANACESFANTESKSALHDEFLYKNSYIMETEQKRNALRQATLLIGKTATFRILFFSFLFANFLKTKTTHDDFERVLGIALFDQPLQFPALSKQNQAQLKKTFRVGFDLDPEFTISTNSFCLQLLGIRKPLRAALDFDFLRFFESHQTYLKLLSDFSVVTK